MNINSSITFGAFLVLPLLVGSPASASCRYDHSTDVAGNHCGGRSAQSRGPTTGYESGWSSERSNVERTVRESGFGKNGPVRHPQMESFDKSPHMMDEAPAKVEVKPRRRRRFF